MIGWEKCAVSSLDKDVRMNVHNLIFKKEWVE